ncbi:MAG: hypothetical protein A2177_07955 [Spirochaetes bacterium RBG_13_68_11]|nr:MAG: hypothetical protein A2177_07955 [Spirochaetes bacterium RBG_13_68_11]
MPPLVAATQLGFLCDARKRFVAGAAAFPGGAPDTFEIQDLALIDAEAFGGWENWKAVLRGRIDVHRGPMGDHLVGEFTALRRPGCYRVMLPAAAGWSHPFVVSDGAFSRLPPILLDFVHAQRCGAFEDSLRGPCHLDDAVRSDTGEPVDVSGGWHDAGDLRKWMTTTPLPVLGFFALGDRLGFARNHWREKHFEDDALSEAAWGVRWVLKMQDPATGLFWEDVGGGGEARALPGTSWWVDNHSGCVADNAGNVFTDNRKASGDERSVRVQYNPIVQYVAVALLADAGDRFHVAAPALARQSRDSALACWRSMGARTEDRFHRWTSVLAWRLLAALRLHDWGVVAEDAVTGLVTGLLDLQADRGFFWMDADRRDPYRGIVNAAQPAIALCSFIERDFEHPLVDRAREALERLWNGYVAPLTAANPYGMMPYGLYGEPRTAAAGDVYHEFAPGLWYRFFMPEHAPERVNHGLAGHWTSWAHALGMMGRVLERPDFRDAAFDQLAWLTGANPLGVSMISGVGVRAAAPYSRFLGPMPGGCMVGPRGTADDTAWVDTEGRLAWSSGEYWMAPLANMLMALAELLPGTVPASRRLGVPTRL